MNITEITTKRSQRTKIGHSFCPDIARRSCEVYFTGQVNYTSPKNYLWKLYIPNDVYKFSSMKKKKKTK